MKDWIIPNEVKPAQIHANLKTHKKNVPYRHIVSLFGTATENLARWSEIFLKEHAQGHPAYLKDTKDFLAHVEDINIRKAPLEEMSTIITTRDITNYYPSCDLEKSIEAVGLVLRNNQVEEKNIQCLQEAVRLTMTKNNIMFKGKHYTQIDGATIGGPNSGSVTDIFGSEFIDKKIDECPYSAEEYRRYRDDTFDVNTDSSLEEQNLVTEWLNGNVYKDKITFTEVSSQVAVEFVDVKTVLHGGFLKTEMYSKPTDINQYLSPDSCHPPHIFKGIPKSVGIRIRRNCSLRWEDDQKFIDNLKLYKGYLITSGYQEKFVNQAFAPLANVQRSTLLKPKRPSQRRTRKKVRFITNYEPAFPDIRKYLHKHKQLLKEDRELRKVFPHNTKDLQVAYRRGGPNMKELLAPSKTKLLHEEDGSLGSEPCGKDCVLCPKLAATRGPKFHSTTTKKWYKIRQFMNCESKNVIYLITCLRHQIQGVGLTEDLKKRNSNYHSHHCTKYNKCGITEHFLESDHDFESDFLIQPIVKITNIPELAYCRRKVVRERLEEFELYWQETLRTIEPYGMNKLEEVERARVKIAARKSK